MGDVGGEGKGREGREKKGEREGVGGEEGGEGGGEKKN